ncbi:choice-of-anchor P family protein [Amycolatopsis sp. GM8]|uniref:choice-of-anchor P family protein n=1 Tax=Amycolatopsis sp. GM8 TaxID=2896530 RepID=UPI001F1B7C7B|nr:choice-of-anchor P family protein [Amycolatopsis sp. GM8]
MRVTVLRSSGVLGLAAGALLAGALTPATAATAPGEGSAYGASAQVSLLPGVLGQGGLTVDTGTLAASSTAGPASASVADVPLRGLVTARAITSAAEHATSTGQVEANASIVDATLPVLAGLTGGTPSASVIAAKCASTASGVTGSSQVVGLDLGQLGTVPVAAAPNTALGLPGIVQVIVNEQIHHDDGSLTVNALHIKLLGGQLTGALGSGDIVLASATCGKATTPPDAPGTPDAPSTPASPNATAAGLGQVSIVPAGAPQTGDGSLATLIEK